MKHHPGGDWLEEYAAGALPAPLALGVSVHLAVCAECRRQVELLQGLGAALMAQLETSAVDEQLLQRVLSAIEIPRGAASTAADEIPASDTHHAVPKPLRRWIARGYDALPWRRALPGLRSLVLDVGDERYSVRLYRMRPGGKLPMHDHRGQELTLVLNGAFSDADGLYGDGDFIVREPAAIHEPIAAQNDACICLVIAAKPVRFTGWPWRLLNPFLR